MSEIGRARVDWDDEPSSPVRRAQRRNTGVELEGLGEGVVVVDADCVAVICGTGVER